MDTKKNLIMIVDDLPANQKILVTMLKRAGYGTCTADGGMEALQLASEEHPDLVLMDINMPFLNGHDTCRRFKASEQLKDIPIIFISANHETNSKIEGFDAGGVDYISKPFDIEEVVARVRIHLKINTLQQNLKNRNEELQKLEESRDNLVHMVVHDMRSHLTMIIAGSELLELELEGKVPQVTMKDAARIKRGGVSLMTLVDDLLDISRMESEKMPLNLEICNLTLVAEEAISSQSPSHQFSINKQFTGDIESVFCDPYLTRRVINNLLSNAVKVSSHDDVIELDITIEKDHIILSVSDNGPGISERYLESIFEKFSQIDQIMGRNHSSGLGLTFCKLAMDAQSGEIGVDSKLGHGCRFWLSLPRASTNR